jgi:serine phosphatase RsbU (regulator of sigma subunit)
LEKNLNTGWKEEFRQKAFNYHSIACFIGLTFNPLFALTDYFNVPEHFSDFLIVRIVVSVSSGIALIFRKRLANHPEVLAYFPFLGIAIQNAYMYSVMNEAEFQKHTFAYLALFIGASMFVFWRSIHSIIIVLATVIANLIFYILFSQLSVESYLSNGGLLVFATALFSILLIQTRTNLTKKEIMFRLALEKSNAELVQKKEIIEIQNKNILDSINYSKYIQNAILPPFEKIDSYFKDYFILFKPKDVVSGDFFWSTKVKTTPLVGESRDVILLSAVDCTGHGVPGALMSIIGSTLLNQSATELTVNSPGEALTFLNKKLAQNLSSISDGMDMSMCAFYFDTMELHYAGANNSIYILRENNLVELKADKMGIGGDHENVNEKKFNTQVYPLHKNDVVFLFTDGFADQFGGESGKKFMYNRFKQLLANFPDNSMEEYKFLLDYHHNQWKGNLEQVDDILVIGVRI